MSKNRTSKVLVSLVGSPCFNIGKICVSIHLFIQAKVLNMWKILQQGDWLTDTHFSGTRNSENTISLPRCLQCTLLSQNNGFSAVHGEAIQIHHINKNHWVTSYSIDQEIMVYDSKLCGDGLSPSLINQLAIIYSKLQKKGEKEVLTLTVDIPFIQQQKGNCDCGDFAIAFAVYAVLGNTIEEIKFNQYEMREHIVNCFRNGLFTPFPTVYFFVENISKIEQLSMQRD